MSTETPPKQEETKAGATEVVKKEEKTESSKPDITLQCKDCHKDFVFSGGEQEFYDEKGFNNKPLRCLDCRSQRRGFRRRRGRGGPRRGGKGCFNCGNEGHIARDCPNKKEPSKRGICYSFRDSGNCQYGDGCRFSHST